MWGIVCAARNNARKSFQHSALLSIATGALAAYAGQLVSQGQLVGIGLLMALPAFAIAIRHPFAGLAAFLALSNLDDLVVLTENLTFTKIVGPGLFAAYMVRKKLFEHRTSNIFPTALKLIIVWHFWGVLSLSWSTVPDASMGRLVTQTLMLVLVFLLVNMIDTPRKMRISLVAFAVGGLLVAALGINAILDNINIQASGRAVASARQSATTFASIAAACTAVFIGLATHSQTRWRFSYLLGAVVAILAILSAAGRGALVSIIAVTIVLLWSKRTSISGLLFVSLLIPALALGLWGAANDLGLLTEQALYRLSIDTVRESGASGRQEISEAFLLYVFPKSPVAGFGLGTAAIVYGQTPEALLHTNDIVGRDAHNTMLFVLIDLGLIGFGLWLAFHAVIVKELWRVASKAKRCGLADIYWTSAFLFVQLFVDALSTTQIWEKRYWIMLGFVMVVVRLADDEAGKAAPACEIALKQRKNVPNVSTKLDRTY